MGWIILGVVCVWLIPVIVPAASDFVWCYLDPSCNDAAWVTLAPKYCAGSRQSPIDIVSKNATYDGNLTALKLNNFNSKTALTKIENTGYTVKVTLASGVSVSGGGLTERYDSLQFHLHWGKGTSVPGSEHTLDGKRFPMEFHIVSLKSSYNGNTTAATADPTGAAALGFFIEVSDNTTGEPASWKTLTSYLSKITQKGQSAALSESISLDDLLPGVDRTKFYRYKGSLTTPNCYEVVVWTVFKQPVKVSKDLIDLFSNTVHIGNSTSPYMVNVYRNLQPALPVTYSSSPKTSFCSGLLLFGLALWMT